MSFQGIHLVSIVTVSLDNRTGLEKTILSVISQENVAFEFIIVDGGSGDGSLEIIEKYSRHISKWLSGHDNGPYDAMNKGAAMADGKWIIFLNSGDTFFDRTSLSQMAQQLDNHDPDALYGDSLADYHDFAVYRKAGSFNDIWKGMIFSHQALIARTSLIKECRFDPDLQKIADYDLVLRCLKVPGRVHYLPIPFVICDAYGMSARGQAAIVRDYYRRSKQYYPMTLGRNLYFLKRFVFLMIIDTVKKVLPGRSYYRMIRLFLKDQPASSKSQS